MEAYEHLKKHITVHILCVERSHYAPSNPDQRFKSIGSFGGYIECVQFYGRKNHRKAQRGCQRNEMMKTLSTDLELKYYNHGYNGYLFHDCYTGSHCNPPQIRATRCTAEPQIKLLCLADTVTREIEKGQLTRDIDL